MNSSDAGAQARKLVGPSAPEKRESRIAVLLCVLCAVRVFVFSAAFPFFNNVDEQSHFDLVCKYSRGHVPAGLDHRGEDASRLIALYWSPEYLRRPEDLPGGVIPPPRWPVPVGARSVYEQRVAESTQRVNYESTQPPFYYVVAGGWYRIGEWIGVRGGHALYWTRLLNVFVCAALTWLAYAFARTFFPDRSFLRLGVPLLVAFFPQDVFYSVNNDVFLPLVNGAAFFCLLRIYRGERRSLLFHAGAGLLVAAAILVKFSSVAIVPVAAALIALDISSQRIAKERKAAIIRGAVLFLVAAIPVGVWCLRNELLLGDITGSMSKTRFLGWTLKPVAAMFDHPIFSLSGMAVFWQETLVRFWRGEFVWSLQVLASAGWDRVYGVSSLAFLVVAMIASRTWRKQPVKGPRSVLWPSLAFFLLSLAFLASISVMFDFGSCFYPSSAKPYMTSGRLALGALIPFAALYLCGLDALLPLRLPAPVRFAVLIVPVAWMTLSEIYLSGVAFQSAYNWFHMIRRIPGT